jgi:ribosomal protein S16
MQKMLKQLGGMTGLAGGGKKSRRRYADAQPPVGGSGRYWCVGRSSTNDQRPRPTTMRSVTAREERASSAVGKAMVAIRLRRAGSKAPKRVVVTDSRAARTRQFVEILSHHNPRKNRLVDVNKERVDFWIKQGAQPRTPSR